jgi:hypothetical protein
VKIYVSRAAVEALRKKERQYETQFTTKIGAETSLGPSYFVFFCKIVIPSYTFDGLLCRGWHSRPLIVWTLWINLIPSLLNFLFLSFEFLLGVFELGKVMEGFFV